MTPTELEQRDSLLLRRAQEFLEHCREAENEARRNLADAIETTKRAKEKYELTFSECEGRACARRKAGLITVNPGY